MNNTSEDKINSFLVNKESIIGLLSLVEKVAIKAKYEYIEFYYKQLPITHSYGLFNFSFTPHFVITGAYEDKKYNISTIELLNQLGSRGWRFVSVTERRFTGENSQGRIEFYHSHVYFLERQLSQFCLDKLANIVNNENIESKDTKNEDAEIYNNENIESKDTENEDPEPLSLFTIEELQLSGRAYSSLKRSGIHSIKDLLEYTRKELSELLKHRRTEEEVVETLKKRFDITLNSD